jgi:hypothetical protein
MMIDPTAATRESDVTRRAKSLAIFSIMTDSFDDNISLLGPASVSVILNGWLSLLPYDLALNPKPPMAIPAVPTKLFLMNSRLSVNFPLFVISLPFRN